jgi:heavy metal sensor kinase
VKLKIRTRITIWYLALLAVIVVGVGAFLVLRLRADLMGSLDGSLGPAAEQIAAGYRVEGPPELRDTAHTVLSGERPGAQALGPDGRVIAHWGDAVAAFPMVGAADRAAVIGGERFKRTIQLGRDKTDFRVVARSVTRGGQEQVVVAAESQAPVNRSVHRVLVLLLIACPVALLLTALGGWWLARRALRPIDRMTTAAEAIGVEQLGERLEVPRAADEVAHLALTLNTMLSRIQSGVEAQQRLVADASHELRTPLAAMRSELDVSLREDDLSPSAREALESAREEVDRMSRTVDDLLMLASADEGRIALAKEPVDLAEIARLATGSLRALAARRGVRLEAGGTAVLVLGDPERLRHAVRNLIENAIKFSPPGSVVEVRTGGSGQVATLAVMDEGPGVAAEHRDRIFERFYRADSARTRGAGGSGLGLAIVREVVEAHGGRVGVQAREPAGSVFSLEMPAIGSGPGRAVVEEGEALEVT